MRSRKIRRNLDKPNRPLGEGEDIAGVGKRDRPQQRLEMETIRDFDHRFESIRDAKGADVVRGSQDRQAVRLKAPELAVIDKVVQMLGESYHPALVGARSLELVYGLLCQVLQFNAITRCLLTNRRRL